MQSHSNNANNQAPKPVVRGGPSDLRPLASCPVVAYARMSFASVLHPSLLTVLVQDVWLRRTASVAGVISTWRGHSPVGVRSKDSLVERRRNPVNTRHNTDAVRAHSKTHNRRNTKNHKGKENKESRGVHPFVISNVLRTAVRPRAALPALNVQSLHPSSMT